MPVIFDRYRRNTYILATGVNDICRERTSRWPTSSTTKEIPCRLDVWGDNAGHDWPTWQRMMQTYL